MRAGQRMHWKLLGMIVFSLQGLCVTCFIGWNKRNLSEIQNRDLHFNINATNWYFKQQLPFSLLFFMFSLIFHVSYSTQILPREIKLFNSLHSFPFLHLLTFLFLLSCGAVQRLKRSSLLYLTKQTKSNKAASDLKLWKQQHFHKETSNRLQNKGASETLKSHQTSKKKEKWTQELRPVSGKAEQLMEDAERYTHHFQFTHFLLV